MDLFWRVADFSLDAFATLLVSLVGLGLLIICKQNDFLSEHAGHPKSGIDPVRVSIFLAYVFIVIRIWR